MHKSALHAHFVGTDQLEATADNLKQSVQSVRALGTASLRHNWSFAQLVRGKSLQFDSARPPKARSTTALECRVHGSLLLQCKMLHSSRPSLGSSQPRCCRPVLAHSHNQQRNVAAQRARRSARVQASRKCFLHTIPTCLIFGYV